jgi:hypothetical protein
MIDIGTDETEDRPVVRVHVRGPADTLPELPDQFDGIPVRLVYGKYRLEEGAP